MRFETRPSILIASFLSLFVLAGCGNPIGFRAGGSPAKAQFVVQSAEGRFYSLACLKHYGLNDKAKSQCEVAPSKSMSSSPTGVAKALNTRALDSTTALILAYLLYPPNYNESSFCSYNAFGYPCYSYFGYPSTSSLNLNYSYSNANTTWNSCDQCLSNPFSYACLFGSSWSCVPSYSYAYYYSYGYGYPYYGSGSNCSSCGGGGSGTVTVACVGGPAQPSYAFWDFSSANYCAQYVASYSQSCRSNVRVGYCTANTASVGTVPASLCNCSPGYSVGHW
jgi:hypothetical protein